MPAPITDHEIDRHPDDDQSHPIPNMGVVDLIVESKTGEIELLIIVASPLQADPRSQTRLLDKIGGYLSYVSSSEFCKEFGAPSPNKTRIIVKLHPNSAPIIRELLTRCHDWVGDNNAALSVEDLEP
jgi:hypothetical protein